MSASAVAGRSIPVVPGLRHVLRFGPAAIARGQSVNYLLGGRIALHVVVRASAPAVVVNDMAEGRWQSPLLLPLPPAPPGGAIAVDLAFTAEGVVVRLEGAEPGLFDRCIAPGETLTLRLPAGIDLAEHDPEPEIAPIPEPEPEPEPVAPPPAAPAVLRAPTVLVAATDLDALKPLLALLDDAAIDVAALRDVQDGALVLETEEGDRLLPAPPPACLGLIAASQPGYALLRQAAAWLAERGMESPAPILPGPEDTAAAIAGIAAAALRELRTQQALLAETLSGLATLRQVRDDQQQRMAALEDVLARRNLQPFALAFEEGPAPDLAELALVGPAEVTQLLPVASRGVSAVALHVAAPAQAGAELAVALDSLEDGVARGRWTLRLDEVSSGWVVLGLEQGVAGLNRSLRLTATLAAGRVALSLGAPQPLPAFRVAGPAGEAAERSLAFRVWAGLPGLPAPFPATDHAEDGAAVAHGFEEIPLDLDTTRLLHGPDAWDASPTLLHLPREDAVALQAPPQGLAVAQLPAALPDTAVLASAGIALAEGAPAVRFALAGGTDPAALEALAIAGGPPAPGWSGWVTLAAGGAETLKLFLPALPGPARDLLLFAALAEPGPNDTAWARFSSLAVTLRLARDIAEAPTNDAPAWDAPPPSPATTLVPVEQFEGSGFHEVESEGARSWRWFSPDATLLLRRQGPDLGGVTLLVASAAPGVTLERLLVSVNGTDVPVRVVPAEGGVQVLVPVPAPLVPRDGRVAIRFAADAAYTAPGDARPLAFVCTGLRLGMV